MVRDAHDATRVPVEGPLLEAASVDVALNRPEHSIQVVRREQPLARRL
jgi:hypothetical protein